MEHQAESWAERYREGDTPWDAGGITTPLKTYIDQIENKETKILIPGAGNAHEAEYLYRNGFINTFVCDWAKEAIDNLKARIPEIPDSRLLHADFFKLDGTYDLILEQTFLSALPPSLRPDYAKKMNQLLHTEGVLAGVLFKELPIPQGPPYGGKKEDYQNLFKAYFSSVRIEACYNSIAPRAGNELFIRISKPL